MKAPFPFVFVLSELDGGDWLGEALLLPGLSRLAENGRRALAAMEQTAAAAAGRLSPAAWQRAMIQGEPVLTEAVVDLQPGRKDVAWSTPVSCRFHVVQWSPGTQRHLAWVPALSLMVAARHAEDLPALLQEEMRGALVRHDAVASLATLAWLSRVRRVELRTATLNVEVQAPRERAMEAQRALQKTPSALQEVATNLTESRLRPAFEVDADVRRIAGLLTPPSSRSVLLVGDSGTGKTARVHQLVADGHRHGLGRHTIWATSGARLVAGMGGFGEWEARVGRVLDALKASRSVLYLGNLVELTEVGKSSGHAGGVAAMLRPAIARGEILVIAECTPEQRDVLARDDPALVDAFAVLPVQEPDEATARRILARSGDVPAPALETLIRLHRRYATYSAWPGRPLRFLQAALQAGPVTTASVLSAFTEETGLPRALIDPDVPMVREEVRQWFTSRVLEQDEAVDAVVDTLLVVKATLNRPRRPLASFLFLGPTGVGKTELSRTLAEYLFSDRNRMVRFDMSEYAQPYSIDRLVGRDGQLVARVREQPFCVLLFDEFEKAHPLFFDLLLQVLGDGRLTDALGRVADFRNAVVVMTSNLGAEAYLQGEPGFVQSRDAAARTRQHFVHAVQSFLRPELYNRIERVIPFTPLTFDGALRVVEREIERMRQRDGIKYRNLGLDISADVAPWVLARSFDRRYGARTLRRFLEQRVLGPLADRLNQVPAERPVQARLSIADGELAVDVTVGVPTVHSAFGSMTELQALRRDAQRLQGCRTVAGLHNSLSRLLQVRKRQPWQDDQAARLQEVLARVDELVTTLSQEEDALLMALYDETEATLPDMGALRVRLRQDVLRVYGWQTGGTRVATIGVYGESTRYRRLLAETYVKAALASGLTVLVAPVELTPDPGATVRLVGRRADASIIELIVLLREFLQLGLKEAKMLAETLPVTPTALGTVGPILGDSFSAPDAQALAARLRAAGGWTSVSPTGDKLEAGVSVAGEAFLDARPEGGVGWAVEVAGPLALARFAGEVGLHSFVDGQGSHGVVVQVDHDDLEDFYAPRDAHRRSFLDDKPRRRTYRMGEGEADDPQAGRKLPMGADFAAFVAGLLEERLWLEACRMLEDAVS